MTSQRPDRVELLSPDPETTRRLGERLAGLARPGDLILLDGDLGTGKTTLTQGIGRGLGITGYVQSPTFTLVTEHPGHTATGQPLTLYHLDLYRLTDEADLATFGFEEYLSPPNGLTVIEWPDRAAGLLLQEYLLVTLRYAGEGQRHIRVEAKPAAGRYSQVVAAMVD